MRNKMSKKHTKEVNHNGIIGSRYELKDINDDKFNQTLKTTDNALWISESNLKLSSKSRNVEIVKTEKGENLNVLSNISSEFICPICLDYFILPITIPCGHTFCRYCITHNRLLGKNCPVCRQVIGYNFRTNMAIHNVVMMLGMTTFNHFDSQEVDTTELFLSNDIFSKEYRPKWWQLCFCKPIISVTLFSRIIADEILGIGIVFAEDLTRCIIDRLSRATSTNSSVNHLIWSNGIYMIGPFETQLLTKWIGCPLLPFDHSEHDEKKKEDSDFILNNNTLFKNQIKQWVETCIALKPTVLNIGKIPFAKVITHPIIRIISDRIHRVESKIFDLGLLRSPLPWDLGRHSKSTIQIPHSSVSTNHLLIVNIKEHNQIVSEISKEEDKQLTEELSSNKDNEYDWGIGVIDLGSSIGTMLKIQSNHQLDSDEIIHLADRVEIITKVRSISYLNNETNYIHQNNKLLIKEWRDFRWSKKLNRVINISEYIDSFAELGNLKSNNTSPSISEAEFKKTEYFNKNSVYENYDMNLHIEELGLEEINEYLEVYIPVNVNSSIPCEGAEKTENGEFWSVVVHPLGMVFGRGKTGELGLRKVEITENNGYISREHCVFYYSVSNESNNGFPDNLKKKSNNWYVKDISTSGTFVRLKPFSSPLRLVPGMTLKVGQCKVEVFPYITTALHQNVTVNPVNGLGAPLSESMNNIQGNYISYTDNNNSGSPQVMHINQIPTNSLDNSLLFSQLVTNPYFTSINHNFITQMNLLAAYSYMNLSGLSIINDSSRFSEYFNLFVEDSVRRVIPLSGSRESYGSRIDGTFTQNLFNELNNNLNDLNTSGSMQTREDSTLGLGNLENNYLELQEQPDFEMRPREPRTTQEGDVSFDLINTRELNDNR
ncbi:zinc finger protein [Cryptosporidium bovis]|uniref:zinc finger protein n=1 Tax=Cryptosporidium bovis TaxID=310047 RepID=UPI003519E1D9|nr:zinc finger protein [Cryptosporidium bovis]